MWYQICYVLDTETRPSNLDFMGFDILSLLVFCISARTRSSVTDRLESLVRNHRPSPRFLQHPTLFLSFNKYYM